MCWAGLRAPVSKRLGPMLPVLMPLLRRDGELALTAEDAGRLMRMSAPSVDQRLADAVPRFVEIVLVGHEAASRPDSSASSCPCPVSPPGGR